MVVNNEWEALSVAVEMEQRAIRMYQRALMLTADEAVRSGIEAILHQEQEHLRRFTEMRESCPSDPSLEKALIQAISADTLFPGGVMEMQRAQGLTTIGALYAFAAQSEQHAMETYLSFAEKCRDARVAEAFRSIAAEEGAHLVALREQGNEYHV